MRDKISYKMNEFSLVNNQNACLNEEVDSFLEEFHDKDSLVLSEFFEQNINRLSNATRKILDCENRVGAMHEAVHEMYNLYCQYSVIDAHNQNDEEIILPSGKAISPASAAHCLLEMVRTAKFLRGINLAIKDKLQTTEMVRILYAGCGPYATLITPLLTQFANNQITVDLLDINEYSLLSAQKVIHGFKFDKFVEDCFLTDAATFKIEKEYDMVISETLQSALRNEPFVAIYQNLVPQAKEDCIFIPEEVIIDLKLNSLGKWNAEKMKVLNSERIDCGNVIKINKQTVLTQLPVVVLDVLNVFENQRSELKFYTTVVVYNDEVLTESECSLNLPLKIDVLENGASSNYEFKYEQDYPAHIKIKTNKISLVNH